MTEINVGNITAALDVANDLRRQFNEEELKRLPKGIPVSSSECILARAFNFGCKFYPGDLYGIIEFADNFDKAKTLNEIIKFRYPGFDTNLDDMQGLSFRAITFRIPFEISQIAKAFDEGLLPEYEANYEIDRKLNINA